MRPIGALKSFFGRLSSKRLSLSDKLSIFGLLLTCYIFHYENKDSKLVVFGYVYEQNLNTSTAIPGAILDFPTQSPLGKGTTDRNGRYSFSIRGQEKDSIFLRIVHPDGRFINKTVLVDFDKSTLSLDTIFFLLSVPSTQGHTKINTAVYHPVLNGVDQSDGIKETNAENKRDEYPNDKVIQRGTTEEASIDDNNLSVFVIQALKNGKYNPELYSQGRRWLSDIGSVTAQPLMLPASTVTQILNGKTGLICQTTPKQSKYVCLISVDEQFEKSSVYESVTIVKWHVEILILDKKTGDIRNSFSEDLKAPGISTLQASKKILSDFISYLNRQKTKISI